MRKTKLWLVLGISLLLTTGAWAQGNPTGKINGTVSNAGQTIPGVRITAESESLQQPRQVFSQANGDYLIGALPPGTYKLSFELEGFETQKRSVEVAVAAVQVFNVDLAIKAVSEEIVVVGESSAISETATVATTVDQDFVEKLAVARTITAAVALSPGTAATGPNGNISISGGQSFENLYMINGVPVNENLRGQPADLFIEDAILETNIMTAGVSAEWGRFTGGVINTVTKSGGNRFTASLRDNLTNEEWASQTPQKEAREDSVNDVFEGTLGGYLWQDHIWFFLAARQRETQGFGTTEITNFSFPQTTEEDRLQGSLSFSLTPSHQLRLVATDVTDDRSGNTQGNGALDSGAVNDNVSFPEDSLAASYVGIVTEKFFLEAQYSERSLAFLGIGGFDNNLRSGTPWLDTNLGGIPYHQPTFCGNCENPTSRETEHAIVTGSYFLSTENAGSHDLVFGVDTFNDIISGDNTQSATNFEVWSSSTIIRNGEVFPQVVPFPTAADTFIIYRPILESSLGNDIISNSAFVNDRWQVNDKLSLNLGLRYDENDGVDSAGNKVADDNRISPRLGASYDLRGDGDLVLNASFGRYVTRLANGVANGGSAAGSPAFFGWLYAGDPINPDPDAATLTNADDALDIVFDWFESVGGTDNGSFLFDLNIPGATSKIDGSLDSPIADEISVGINKRLGSRGVVRADYVRRDYGDFYLRRTDANTGTVIDGNGDPQDFTLIGNDDTILERVYDGLHTSFHYRLTDRLDLGGNWTWSHARGNWDGETARSGPVSGQVGRYPEYKAFEQNNPRGDLGIDQRHKVRAWLLWDVFTTGRQSLNISFMESFFSGTPYGALGSVASAPFVQDAPAYVTPPTTVNYFFTSPNEFQTDDVTRTDLAINYSFHLNVGGRQVEIFLQPEIFNVFDEDGAFSVNTSDVLDATSSAALQPFDPFTDTPVQGVNWDVGDNFGKPEDELDFQTPRTFRFSVGFRF